MKSIRFKSQGPRHQTDQSRNMNVAYVLTVNVIHRRMDRRIDEQTDSPTAGRQASGIQSLR